VLSVEGVLCCKFSKLVGPNRIRKIVQAKLTLKSMRKGFGGRRSAKRLHGERDESEDVGLTSTLTFPYTG